MVGSDPSSFLVSDPAQCESGSEKVAWSLLFLMFNHQSNTVKNRNFHWKNSDVHIVRVTESDRNEQVWIRIS